MTYIDTNLSHEHGWAKLLSLGGRYSYKLLAKKRLPLQLQVTVLKSSAVTVTSYSIFS